MSNSNLNQTPQKPKFSVAISQPGYLKLIRNTLGDPERAKRFVASITAAVATNPQLQDCDSASILAGGLLGESLNLSPSPQIGHYYLVPFESKVKDRNGKIIYLIDENGEKRKDSNGRWIALTEKKAQFTLGYKGYMQLAQRSGYVTKLDVVSIKEGELKHFDPIKGNYEFEAIQDADQRDQAPTMGYFAYFELANGFRKEIYWSREQMEHHADKYSQAFSLQAYRAIQDGKIADKDMWKYSSHWYTKFDIMAEKTMLRQLISRGGCPMSTEMIRGFESDNSISELKDNGDIVTTAEDVAAAAKPDVVEQPQPEENGDVQDVDFDKI
jgi:recombination protein RecT